MRKADAAALQVRAEREDLRRRELAAIEAVSPALAVDGEAPVVAERLTPLSEGVVGSAAMLTLDRPKAGSSLRVFRRDAADLDGVVSTWALVSVFYRGANGLEYRTRGACIRREELAAVAEALFKLADDLDSAEGIE